MIRRIALAAILFIFSGSATNAQLSSVVCSMSSSGVNFGDVMGQTLSSMGAIVLRCTGNGTVGYTISLTTGLSGIYGLRQMSNGTDMLGYNLYAESSLATIWGVGTGGSQVVAGKIQMGGNLVVITVVPIFARLPVQRAPSPGSYTDTIVASLHYPGNTVQTAFQVTAHVAGTCTVAATDLLFGDYTQAQLDGQSSISVGCTNLTPWNLGLNQGTSPGATVTTRKMTGPGGTSLSYRLDQDPARSVNWGNTVGTDTMPGTGTGSAQIVTVYGRIPPSQTPVAGGYRDMITATLTF